MRHDYVYRLTYVKLYLYSKSDKWVMGMRKTGIEVTFVYLFEKCIYTQRFHIVSLLLSNSSHTWHIFIGHKKMRQKKEQTIHSRSCVFLPRAPAVYNHFILIFTVDKSIWKLNLSYENDTIDKSMYTAVCVWVMKWKH